MFVEFSILFVGNNKVYFESKRYLQKYGFKCYNCSLSLTKILINAVKYTPAIIVLDATKLNTESVISLQSKLATNSYIPILYNTYSYYNPKDEKILHKLGVDLNFPLPLEGLTLANNIKLLFDDIPLDAFSLQCNIWQDAIQIFENMGILSSKIGINYLADAVAIASFEDTDSPNMSKYIYPFIAKVRNVSASSVERAIRIAVTAAWEQTKLSSPDFSENIWDKKPTNTKIIMDISNKLRTKYSLYIKKFLKSSNIYKNDLFQNSGFLPGMSQKPEE